MCPQGRVSGDWAEDDHDHDQFTDEQVVILETIQEQEPLCSRVDFGGP